MNRRGFLLSLVLLFASALGHAATPGLVQHVVYSTNSTDVGKTFEFSVPNATLAGNYLVLKVYYHSTGTLSTIADGTADSWSTTTNLIATVTDSTNAVKLAVFGLPNNVGGATLFTLTFSGNVTGVNVAFQEWYNIATTSATDGSHTAQPQVAASAAVASGSFTTGTNGDLILHFAEDDDDGPNGFSGEGDSMTLISPASGYTLLQADLKQGYVSEYQVQATAGATNPGLTAAMSGCTCFWTSVTFALKSASAGTAPSATAVRVIGVYHLRYANNVTGNQKVQFPTIGNTFVATCSQANNSVTISTISGSVSGSWTSATSVVGGAQAFYKTSATAGSNELLTVDVTATTSAVQGVIYDIVHGGAFDTSVGLSGSTAFGPGNSTPANTVTPGESVGIAVEVMGLFTGPPDTIVTPSGGTLISVVYKTAAGAFSNDLSTMDSGDAHGIYYFSSNATQNWVYHDTAASSGLQALVLVFAQQSTSGPPPSQFFLSDAANDDHFHAFKLASGY